MMIDEMMEKYKTKYSGEFNKDYVRDVDCDLAKSKFLIEEYIEGISLELDGLKRMLKGYFDTKRADMDEKAERYALDCNAMAHDIVHDILVVWMQTEKMLPKD